MTDPLAFALASLLLLAAPGPTNVLLAASGAAAGFVRSLHLSVAGVMGYLSSTAALGLVVGPFAHASSAVSISLRIGCGLFLLFAAWRLWREGAMARASAAPVKFRRVLVATTLNPKAIVFAYVIVPHLAQGDVARSWPYMAALAALAALVCAGWIAAGAAARSAANGALRAGMARRAGAFVLCAFAVVMLGSAFSA